MQCCCGSGRPYEACCGPAVSGARAAASPEALMRSRYCAYARGEGDYLVDTTVPHRRVPEDADLIREHASSTEWLGLEILSSTESGDGGAVEFKAYFRDGDGIRVHHEKSRFVRLDGRWYYDEGTLYEAKVGRNDPCPCGSGKKYKKCCGR